MSKINWKATQGYERRRRSTAVLCIFLVVLLLASVFASLVQTSGWSVSVEDLRNVSNSSKMKLTSTDTKEETAYTVAGQVTSGILMVPKNATADTPAPAVVLSHGRYNNREFQLGNGIELARRGYVVLLIDRAQAGHNDDAADDLDNTSLENGIAYLDAAKFLYNMPYVDKTKVAVAGHSRAAACIKSLTKLDGVDAPEFKIYTSDETAFVPGTDAAYSAGYSMGIVSAALIQGNSPNGWVVGSNVRGTGFVKALSDEFVNSYTVKEEVYCPVAKDTVTEYNYTNYFLKSGDEYIKQTVADRFDQKNQYYSSGTAANSNYYLVSKQAMTYVGRDVEKFDSWQVENLALYNAKTGDILYTATEDNLVSQQLNGSIVPELETGSASIRVVYQADETHPMNLCSVRSTGHLIDFFYNVFGTPIGASYIGAHNQTWWIKDICSIFGVVALFGLLFPVLDMLLETRLFSSLKGCAAEAPMLLKKPRKHVSYWLSGILTAWFGAYSLSHYFNFDKSWTLGGLGTLFDPAQGFIYDNVGYIATWGIYTAIFALVITALFWAIDHVINLCVYKEDFASYDEQVFSGFAIRSWQNVLKTPLLALVLTALFWMIANLIWKVFVVDFRLWIFAVKVFELNKLVSMMKYLPYFFIFYMTNAALSQNYRVKDLPEWVTIIFNVIFNVIGITVLFAVQNSYFITTGGLITTYNKMLYICCYGVIPCVAIATVVARRVYTRTGNAWLAGLLNALIMTMIACSNTTTEITRGVISWFYN